MRNEKGQFIRGHKTWNKGKKWPEMSRMKQGNKNPMFGKRYSDQEKKLISQRMKGRLPKNFKEMQAKGWLALKGRTGELSPKYIKDRTKLKRSGDANKDRRSSVYVTWRAVVWKRDNWRCKIANKDCKGRLEAHHILSYTNYPELRYDINNGITLCHFHHPRKRAEEERLSPYFKELIDAN